MALPDAIYAKFTELSEQFGVIYSQKKSRVFLSRCRSLGAGLRILFLNRLNGRLKSHLNPQAWAYSMRYNETMSGRTQPQK